MIFRPLGIAFGIFIVVNLSLALQAPGLSVTRDWLDVSLPEPELSLFAGVLAISLLVPHEAARKSWVRSFLGGVFLAFGVLLALKVASFYRELSAGLLRTDFPVPFGALLVFMVALEFVRVFWWRPLEPVTPPPARAFLSASLVVAAFLCIVAAYIVTFGHVDLRRPADAAVVFGAKVDPDGKPCDALVERLETGIELYRQGLVQRIIMTGAVGPNGQSEPKVMKKYAETRGVPASRIVVDEAGSNTRASAASCAKIARKLGLERVLAVTQYFHCARAKMALERAGVPCCTVPTCSLEAAPGPPRKLAREGFFLLREAVAFPFYLVYHR